MKNSRIGTPIAGNSFFFCGVHRYNAGKDDIRIVMTERPYVPQMEAVCSIVSENAKTEPRRFHGKPVRIKLRSHSLIPQKPAKASIFAVREEK